MHQHRAVGATTVAIGGKETFTCEHTLVSADKPEYTNVATHRRGRQRKAVQQSRRRSRRTRLLDRKAPAHLRILHEGKAARGNRADRPVRDHRQEHGQHDLRLDALKDANCTNLARRGVGLNRRPQIRHLDVRTHVVLDRGIHEHRHGRSQRKRKAIQRSGRRSPGKPELHDRKAPGNPRHGCRLHAGPADRQDRPDRGLRDRRDQHGQRVAEPLRAHRRPLHEHRRRRGQPGCRSQHDVHV